MPLSVVNFKEIAADFSQCFGRAKAELAKSLLWQIIKRRFTPGYPLAARPHPTDHTPKAPESDVEDFFLSFQRNHTPTVSSIPEPETNKTIPVDDQPITGPEPDIPSSRLHTDSLSTLAEAIENENLRELLKDRLENIAESRDMENQALLATALLDEIGMFQAAYSGNALERLEEMRRALRLELEANECELLDSDTWAPEIQRAIKIDYTQPEGSDPIIAKKHALGIKINSRLIKKQEVTLLKSRI